MTAQDELSDVYAEYMADFERCAPFIQRAIDRAGGAFDLDYVREQVGTGQAQLFPAQNSAVITRIEHNPSGKSFVLCWLAGGVNSEILELEKQISTWALSRGCTQVKIIGRRGFVKSLPGYSESATIVVKELKS